MQVKLGDLVQIKTHTKSKMTINKDLWLVIGWNNFNDYITVENIRTGKRCQHKLALLRHFKHGQKMTDL